MTITRLPDNKDTDSLLIRHFFVIKTLMPVNLNTYDFHRVIISVISTALYLQHPKYPNIQLNASIIKHIFL